MTLGGCWVSDRRRQFKVACCEIDNMIDTDHPGTSDEVARALSVSEALPRPLLSDDQIIVAAGPGLARKASEPHLETLATRYRTYVGMARPKAQPHPSKRLHGSPAESDMLA